MDSIITESKIGGKIHELAVRLYPANRSLTGEGVRESLRIIQEVLPALQIHEVPSGSLVFDWVVPMEWNVREAWLEDPCGVRVADFSSHNLHLVGYSIPVDTRIELEVLQNHLYSLPDQPDAIPYVTSYYAPRWGFCMAHNQRLQLVPGTYRAYVDSKLEPGFLTYGEFILPGRGREEVLLSTYICHPSMANNETSGLCVTAFIAKWLSESGGHRYTYRIIFVPETLGSITYLSRHLDHLKEHVVAGFNVTCVGDERCYSYLPSRAGDTLSDKAALHVLKHLDSDFKRYTFLDRGSDERQYCAPGVDLPIATIMRSKYGEYPEYHTSLDDLNFVTSAGLEGGFIALQAAIYVLENNCRPRVTVLGEPQLGRRGLYPTLSTKSSGDSVQTMMDFLAYADGSKTLLEIAEVIGVPMWHLAPICRMLSEHGLIETDFPITPQAPLAATR